MQQYEWQKAFTEHVSNSNGLINICYEALDKHRGTSVEKKTALRLVPLEWSKENITVKNITYQELIKKTCQFAQALKSLNVTKGDRVFTVLPRVAELYVAALGIMRMGAVFSPSFSAFGPEPIQTRAQIGKAKVIVTLASFYQKKVAPIRKKLVDLKHVILINDIGDSIFKITDVLEYESLVNGFSGDYFIEKTQPDDIALLHFTSGTTGKSKGALHAHSAGFYHKISGQMALDFKADDLFWCTADPGWVTGTSYGIVSPLANGLTLLVDQAEFQVSRWYEILQYLRVTNWYTAPTALRMLMKVGKDFAREFDLSSIRYASSVGEPLNPEVVRWFDQHLDILIHDNWWQTETGGIIISNLNNMEVKPGSMGKPLVGLNVQLIKRKSEQEIEFINKSGVQGEIAISVGWPSMFRGYLGDDERYRRCFFQNFYLSGDIATKDDDGYFWFVGRADDIIKSAGHLIGPFEVESTLMEHPAVLEAAVIGKPDATLGELVKAFVALKKDYVWDQALMLDILAFARKRLGPAVAPKEISFIEGLPKTKSGKIMRRLLKAQELKLPEGDISTLESLL